MRPVTWAVAVATVVATAAGASSGAAGPREAQLTRQETRLIVLTDISTLTADNGEPDDTQSLVRLLLYANEFDIEGLIATHTKGKKNVNPQFIEAVVRKYGEVHDTLMQHDSRYPTAGYLLERVKAGLPELDSLGNGKDSEGSDWIISVVDKPDPRPVWIVIWGGPRELAQALWKVEKERSAKECAAFKSKIRVHAIHDQDDTGPWIKKHHPDLFYITSYHAYRGLYRDGNTSLVTPAWVDANVVKNHGPLGEAYPNYKGGDPWGPVRGIKEGDTPSFLYLIPNGLGNPEQPTWGSWGGRFSGPGPQFSDVKDHYSGETTECATVFRWRPAYQASFQARMDWCVKPYGEANHEPVAVFEGDLEQIISPGAVVRLSAAGPSDPDGDRLSYSWHYYSEPSTYKGPLTIDGSDKQQATLVAPKVDSPKTIHVILTVTDDGSPALSSYKRIIITVHPDK